MAYTLREGNYEKLGVQYGKGELIFTFEANKEDECAILLYHKDSTLAERIPVPHEYCLGAVRSVCVPGID
ncbi:MAG: glycogen operon protein GlgX, partial [Roseburia sp.]|nr:glycogen operon protein GlgX [Roseburia sp.]